MVATLGLASLYLAGFTPVTAFDRYSASLVSRVICTR